jgi:septum formation protein
LDLVGVSHEAIPSGVPEDAFPGETPLEQVRRLAREKALHVGASQPGARLVIGADTLVVLGDSVLGQPRDEQEARAMLRALSGATHTVITGVFLLGPGGAWAHGDSTSRVTFHPISEEEIRWYVASGEPMDKAGAYAAQGLGAVFIRSIEGSFHNVVGFPLDLFYRMLPEVGLDLASLRRAR